MSQHNYLDNKYTRWYFSIINNAKQRATLEGYTENHHIVPLCLGGDNSLENLVRLTGREHFICHKLLVKMVNGQAKYKMYEAVASFHLNLNRDLIFNSRDISALREANSVASSIRNKGNQYYKLRKPDSESLKITKSNNAKESKWINNGFLERFSKDHISLTINHGYSYGRMKSVIPRKKPMDNAKKITFSDSRNRAISEKLSGVSKSEKHKQSMSVSQKMRENMLCKYCGISCSPITHSSYHGDKCYSTGYKKPQYTCAHCGKTCDAANYSRHHGEKCKFKP